MTCVTQTHDPLFEMILRRDYDHTVIMDHVACSSIHALLHGVSRVNCTFFCQQSCMDAHIFLQQRSQFVSHCKSSFLHAELEDECTWLASGPLKHMMKSNQQSHKEICDNLERRMCSTGFFQWICCLQSAVFLDGLGPGFLGECESRAGVPGSQVGGGSRRG